MKAAVWNASGTSTSLIVQRPSEAGRRPESGSPAWASAARTLHRGDFPRLPGFSPGMR